MSEDSHAVSIVVFRREATDVSKLSCKFCTISLKSFREMVEEIKNAFENAALALAHVRKKKSVCAEKMVSNMESGIATENKKCKI